MYLHSSVSKLMEVVSYQSGIDGVIIIFIANSNMGYRFYLHQIIETIPYTISVYKFV